MLFFLDAIQKPEYSHFSSFCLIFRLSGGSKLRDFETQRRFRNTEKSLSKVKCPISWTPPTSKAELLSEHYLPVSNQAPSI